MNEDPDKLKSSEEYWTLGEIISIIVLIVILIALLSNLPKDIVISNILL
jgi:hypothetical protein